MFHLTLPPTVSSCHTMENAIQDSEMYGPEVGDDDFHDEPEWPGMYGPSDSKEEDRKIRRRRAKKLSR